MRDAETTLAIIRKRGARGLYLEKVYRRLFNPDLYLSAYDRIGRNDGAMTRGTTEETVDGMSLEMITKIIDLLRFERYCWTPARREYIPKPGTTKQRPLGIPTWSDKLVQEAMRSILDAYYEPQFSDHSHGFRPERGCHSALKNIFHAWRGTKWFIEGDIKGCFDNIDHTILLSIIREKIQDNRFLRLVENLLKAGYLEAWVYKPTLSGTPQGGVISPILANIYLDRFDQFVEKTLIPEYTRGKDRKRNPEYVRLNERIRGLKRKGTPEKELTPLRRELRLIGSTDPMDSAYRRLRYIRYADDSLLGFDGPRDEAEKIKEKIGTFLRDNLKLELSPEKTLITHAASEAAKFLGYNITTRRRGLSPRGIIKLLVPPQVIDMKVKRYMMGGKPTLRPELMNDSDFTIVDTYGREYRGIVQYYSYAHNAYWLSRLHYVMGVSLLKTLAAKHRSTVKMVYRRLKTKEYHQGRLLTCMQVTAERDGRQPLIAQFGGLRLRPDPLLNIVDKPFDTDRIAPTRSDLIQRLLAEECELCGSKEHIQVHHVRKLADLKKRWCGRKTKPTWVWHMSARCRKTLVVCRYCHTAIHAGRPTRTRPK